MHRQDLFIYKFLARNLLISCNKAILEIFWGTMSNDITIAKDFLIDINERFTKNEKPKTSTLLENLVSIRYKGNIKSTLWTCLIHLSFTSLRTCSCIWYLCNQFKLSYKCQKENGSLNKLISLCIQEEERLK